MPLDGKLSDYQIDMSELKHGCEGLKQMSHLLRHSELWEKKFVWDFGQVLDRDSYRGGCGSIGCAIGVASLYWGESTNLVAMKLTGAELMAESYEGDPAARRLFFSSVTYNKSASEVFPSEVANKIDEYLETHHAA